MTVSTGQLDVGKQEVVLFITGVSAKDQPGGEREQVLNVFRPEDPTAADYLHLCRYRVFYFTGPTPKSSKCQPVSKCFQKKLEYLNWSPLKFLSVRTGPP